MIDTAEAYGNERAVGEGILKSGVDRKAVCRHQSEFQIL